MNQTATLIGRIGLSLLFIIAGWGKIAGYAGTQEYMQAMGVPGALLPLVIALELGGGLALLAGLGTRWLALAFAAFSVASGFLFHWDLADTNQTTSLLKNLAIAGGFLALYAAPASRYSLDALFARRNTEGATA
ncbi:DoxX family protein [Thermomonas brevis]